jgi:hypothetical protein
MTEPREHEQPTAEGAPKQPTGANESKHGANQTGLVDALESYSEDTLNALLA